MTRIEIVVGLQEGLHTRPAGLLAEMFEGIEGRLVAGNREADLSSMLSLMTLGIKMGERVIIETPEEIDDANQQRIREILEG